MITSELRQVLQAVQEFGISVSRAVELICNGVSGVNFNPDDLPPVSNIFGFDEIPLEKYKELKEELELVRGQRNASNRRIEELTKELEGINSKIPDDIKLSTEGHMESAISILAEHYFRLKDLED